MSVGDCRADEQRRMWRAAQEVSVNSATLYSTHRMRTILWQPLQVIFMATVSHLSFFMCKVPILTLYLLEKNRTIIVNGWILTHQHQNPKSSHRLGLSLRRHRHCWACIGVDVCVTVMPSKPFDRF